MANVTLTIDEYKALENKVRVAEDAKTALEAELVAARSEDPSGRLQKMIELARALLTPLRFGIANMPPETVRNWPTTSLRAIALLIPHFPDFGADDQSFVADLLGFADEADRVDRHAATIREMQRHVAADAERAAKLAEETQ